MRVLVFLLALSAVANAADWPTYLHDYSRSGATAESLAFPLAPLWTHGKPGHDAGAWPDEARRDEYRPTKALRNRFSFDRANHVVVVGGRAYFGSAQSHWVRCVDAVSGAVVWTYFSDGPVRMAPMIADGRVYFGSDDGSAYCLDAEKGTLIWKHTAAGNANRLIPNDGRLVSPWAVRTGVAVEKGIAYFGAGLFPHEGVFLCAVDAATGQVNSSDQWKHRFDNQASLQGALLLAEDRVIVPGGRSTPWAFERGTGKAIGQFNDKRSAMGSFAVLAGSTLLYGPAGRGGALLAEAGPDFKAVNLFNDANLAAVTEKHIALGGERGVSVLNRETRRTVWGANGTFPEALVVAGDAVIVGGDGEVRALSLADGKELWRSPVIGRALGLAVSDGRLFVSTDTGQVFAFGQPQ